MPRRLTLIATAIVALLLAWGVWPTPWAYRTHRGDLVRVSRITGSVERLTGEGWRAVGPNTPTSPVQTSAGRTTR